MSDIKKIIEENMQKYFYPVQEPFTYRVLRAKLFQLASLGIELGSKKQDFEQELSKLDLTEMFSKYSNSVWGFYSPNILNDFLVVNVKKPKRLYQKQPKSEKYYQYYFWDNKVVCINGIDNDESFRKKYIYTVGNSVFSFEFSSCDYGKSTTVYISEATYDDGGNILSFASIITAGLPESERTDENIKKIYSRSIMDYQFYHYTEDGKLDYADNYTSIYNFSPQLIGMKLGDRFKFIYCDDNIVGIELDKSAVPCVFEFENPEEEKFDPSGRIYEFLKRKGMI